jgi:hypothetical protein
MCGALSITCTMHPHTPTTSTSILRPATTWLTYLLVGILFPIDHQALNDEVSINTDLLLVRPPWDMMAYVHRSVMCTCLQHVDHGVTESDL